MSGKLLTLVSGDLRFPVSKPALAPLDLFRAQPALLEGRSYELKARVSQEVLEGFVAALYDPSENVDINWRNAGEFRSLAHELGFHGFDAQLESVGLKRASEDTESVPLEIKMYQRQIEAQDARISKLEAQLAEVVEANEALLEEVQFLKSSAVSRSDIFAMQEKVEDVDTELYELHDSAIGETYELREKVSEIEAVAERMNVVIPISLETMRVAQVVYGLCAEFGFGSECNLEEAAAFYKAAAGQGNAYGQLHYGQCLFDGKGVAVDQRTALNYFEKAAEQGNSSAMFFCGQCYEQGKGTLKLPTKAAQWYKKSADLGNSSGQCGYGRCLENGIGVERDLKEAARYYKLSADQKNPNGRYCYGACLENGNGLTEDKCQAAYYYKLAALQGHSGGQVAYGMCLFNGIGVRQNKALGVRYFGMASDSGDADGHLCYANALNNGDGVSCDIGEAARCFKLAADQGKAIGQVNYGICLWQGNGVDMNLDDARKYLRRAADQGNAAGQYYYALFLLNCGQELDDKMCAEIAHYYKLSADQKFPQAENAYGQCLEAGFGVERDLEKAAEYYLRASQNGNQ